MSTNYDQLVEQETAALNEVKAELETIRKQFVDQTAIFAAEWFDSESRRRLEMNLEKVSSLTDLELGQLKGKVRKLIEDSHNYVESFLGDSAVWWHLSEDMIPPSYEFKGNRPPEIVDKAVRLAIGVLATVLEEYGLLPKVSSMNNSETWREFDKTGTFHLTSGRPYYPYGLDWAEDMRNTINIYDEKSHEGRGHRSKISAMASEKKRDEFREKWESL